MPLKNCKVWSNKVWYGYLKNAVQHRIYSKPVAIPNDYEGIKKNKEFLIILSIITRQRKRVIEKFDFIIDNLEVVLDNLKKELEFQ